MDQIMLVILGSMLALVTSFLMEGYKNIRHLNEERRNLRIILKLELKNTLKIIDNLIDRYGTVSFYDFKILNQLESSIARLEKIREKVIYLKEDSKKEEVLSCINSLAIFYSDVRSLEGQAFEKFKEQPTSWNEDNYKGQRQIFATKSVDLKRRIQDILNYLER